MSQFDFKKVPVSFNRQESLMRLQQKPQQVVMVYLDLQYVENASIKPLDLTCIHVRIDPNNSFADLVIQFISQLNLSQAGQLQFNDDEQLYEINLARKNGRHKDDLPCIDMSQKIDQFCKYNQKGLNAAQYTRFAVYPTTIDNLLVKDSLTNNDKDDNKLTFLSIPEKNNQDQLLLVPEYQVQQNLQSPRNSDVSTSLSKTKRGFIQKFISFYKNIVPCT